LLLALILILMAVGGCFVNAPPVPVDATPIAVNPVATLPPYPWTDESAVMDGICFESANDAAGQVFVIRSEPELTAFYDLADNSRLCRRAVDRQAFDFSTGRILAGMWSAGQGCDAIHEVAGFTFDDTARQVTIRLRFMTSGSCNYELVRPFWIGLSGVGDYAVNFNLE
jgi:hypothetical protein